LLPPGPKSDPFVLFMPDPKLVSFELLLLHEKEGIVVFIGRLKFDPPNMILESTVKKENAFVVLFPVNINRIYLC
jgi:hypothetical protein